MCKKFFNIFYLLFVSFVFISSYCKEQKITYLLPEEYNTSKEDLVVHFINVGQGDCALVITPNKNTLLIDAGGSPYWMGEDAYDPGISIVIPYLDDYNIKILDIVLVSHPHGDHFGGLFSVLNLLKIKNFVDNGYLNGDPDYFELLKIVEDKKIPYEQFKENDIFQLDKNVEVKVYYPPKKGFPFEGANNSSIVCKLLYKNFSVLFTGDIEYEVESYLCSKYKNELKSTVLKVPHHGSRTSSTLKFIKTVSPEIAVICCGKNNMFGHPHSEVVSRYNKFRIEIYRTDKDGHIKIITNGEKYTVVTEF